MKKKNERDPLALVKRVMKDGYINRASSAVVFLTNEMLQWEDANKYLERVRLASQIMPFDWKQMAPVGVHRWTEVEGCSLPVSKFLDDDLGVTALKKVYKRLCYIDEACMDAGFKPIYKLHNHAGSIYTPREIISPTEQDAVIVASLFDGTMPE